MRGGLSATHACTHAPAPSKNPASRPHLHPSDAAVVRVRLLLGDVEVAELHDHQGDVVLPGPLLDLLDELVAHLVRVRVRLRVRVRVRAISSSNPNPNPDPNP